MDAVLDEQAGQPVPGVVRVVTTTPLELPAPVAGDPGWLGEQLEARPWLVAAAILGLLGLLLTTRRRGAG